MLYRRKMLKQLLTSETEPLLNQGAPTIASATAQAFFNNPVLAPGSIWSLLHCYPLQGYE